MHTALWPLQQAIYAALTSYQPLVDKVTGVYDAVPQTLIGSNEQVIKTAFPYVTLGEPTNTPFDTKLSFGENIIFPVHCWSNYSGKKEAYEILNLILGAMSKPLSLDGGFSIVDFQPQRPAVIQDIDGLSWHGIEEFRFYINN